LPSETACFSDEIALFFEGKIRHDCRMANFKRLRDLYRFTGFVPRDRVRGIFGDPVAVVVPLRRLRKKRSAAFAVTFTTPTTTNGPDAFATSPAATSGSTSHSSFEGSFVRGAVA
jgi:hypothetical protein